MTSIEYLSKQGLVTLQFDETNIIERTTHREILATYISENKPGLRVILADGRVWFPRKETKTTHVVRVIYGFRNEAFKKMREASTLGKTVPTYPYECEKALTGGTEILVDAAGNYQPATVITCEQAEKATLDKVVGNGHHVKPVLRILNEL